MGGMADDAFEKPGSDNHAAQYHRSVHHKADVIIVGAGIFGTTMAITMARQSRSVFLLERSLKEPNRIVGELLQPGGVEALRTLHLEGCLQDIDAVQVKGYEVIYHDRSVSIPYPVDLGKESGSYEGRSFHHGRFVQKLRAAAAAEPNITIVETEVKGTIKTDCSDQVLGVKSVTNGENDYFFASLTIIADGFNSKLRSENTSIKSISRSKFYALELEHTELPSPNHGHVILGEFSPVLLYQISSSKTRALVNVPEGLSTAKSSAGGVKSYIRHSVLPYLPPSIQPSFTQSLENGGLRYMPNSFLPAVTNRVAGLLVGGDAMNMRHPLTGGGMTVALNDIVLLHELLSPAIVPDLGNTRLVLHQMKIFHWRRKNHASVINILAEALYALFAAEDPSMKFLRDGCFDYFTRGGDCVQGPAGLLSGITRKPLVLMYHFFSVVLLSICQLLLSQPIWRFPLTLLESINVLFGACWVLFPCIAAELRC